MQVKCISCGASQNINEAQICSYCGSLIELESAKNNYQAALKSETGNLMAMAETAIEATNWEEALQYFNRVLEKEITNSDAWLGKGIAIVYTSKIGEIKIKEAIAYWKNALKHAAYQEAMGKRVAKEIDVVVNSFYPTLENHFIQFKDLDNSYQELVSKFAILEKAQEYATQLDSLNIKYYETGYNLCTRIIEIPNSYAIADEASAWTKGIIGALQSNKYAASDAISSRKQAVARKEEIKKAALIIIELKNKYSIGLKSFNSSASASPSITVNEKNVSPNQKIKSDKQHGKGTIEINQGSQSNLTAIFSTIGIIVILVALILIWQKNNSDKENLLSNEKERVELILTEVNLAISQTKYETALKYLDGIAWKLNPENNKELVEQYNIRRETLRQIIDSLISQQYNDFALEKNLSTNEQVDTLNIDTESIDKENIFIDSQDAKLTLGEEYEGGIIIKLYYSSSIPHGLIVSKTDLFSGNWNDAVYLCNSYMNDGFTDWHLPSLAELKILFEKKNLVNNFKDNWYWSSTDFNNFAYHLGFISGDELLVPKENTKYVRAVRNF